MMHLIVPIFIFTAAFISAGMCFAVARRWRGHLVKLDWRFFVAMALGLIAIGIFYVGVAHANYHGDSIVPFIIPSRILWGFIIFSTALMAYSVLANNGKGGESGND